MHELFRFLSNLIPAAVILLPILFYYLHKRNILRTKKEILLKEIENGSIVDPEMLAKLEEHYRLVLVLYYVEDLSTSEIAKLTGLTESAVRTRLQRGREKLLKLYTDQKEGGQ